MQYFACGSGYPGQYPWEEWTSEAMGVESVIVDVGAAVVVITAIVPLHWHMSPLGDAHCHSGDHFAHTPVDISDWVCVR